MEGIPVKISEKYKPPRKITLPASVQNKLNAELKLDKYDFQLERFVADQMAKLREQQKISHEAKHAEDKVVTIKPEENMTQNAILTPMPLKPHVQTSVTSHQVVGGINISDFENDTSSPFDSVELKTLNDMEELAHVLGGTGLTGGEKWAHPENGGTTQRWAWETGYPHTHYPVHLPQYTSGKGPGSTSKPTNKEANETTVILQSLEKHITERKAAINLARKVAKSLPGPVDAAASPPERYADKKREVLPNPFPSLNGPSQTVARRIAEMGFPLSRAARATELFGPNEGKVIEFMLEVQSLEEYGYPGERAERALGICNYSREDAIKFLDSTEQIMKLGFNEDYVISALIKSGFDRDKALDSLIS